MSQDAREIAQRIVREVLEDHAATEPDEVEPDLAPPVDVPDIDLRDTDGAAAPDAVADALDQSPSRQAARRIVAEVLASHAEASRSRQSDLPVVAEAEPPGPAATTPVLQPVDGRAAVVPGVPEPPELDADTDVAEDAVAIARRIVASVLSRDDDEGPPPIPDDVHRPVLLEDVVPPQPLDETATPETEDASDLDVVPDADPEPLFEPDLDDAADAAPVPAASESTEEDVVAAEAPAPVVAHGSYALRPVTDEPESTDHAAETLEVDAADPDATPEVDAADLDETLEVGQGEPDETVEVAVPDAGAPREVETPAGSPDTTAVLPPDEEAADPDATTRVPVATLERPAARGPDPEDESTLSIPAAAAPRRTGRWLIASILGAVALTVLLPLAIQALRSLVALS